MPKVSIVIPVFNCEAYVAQSICSVLRQTEDDLEIVAVDDGSTDRCLDILKSLASEDSRIVIQSHQPNSGYPGFARNRAIERATGEFIAFLDGDDLYHPEKLHRVLSVFASYPETEVVFHDVMRFNGPEPPEQQNSSFLANSRFLELAKDCLARAGEDTYICSKDLYAFASLQFVPCHTSSIVVRRAALLAEPIWFPEEFHAGEDGDLWFRLLKNRHFAFVNQVLSYYRQRPGNITSDKVKYLIGAVRIHRDNLERAKTLFSKSERRLYRSKISTLLSDLGYAHSCNLKLPQARRAYGDSLATEVRLDNLMGYLKTFAPRPLIRKYRSLRSEA